jgi:hypothetical protein
MQDSSRLFLPHGKDFTAPDDAALGFWSVQAQFLERFAYLQERRRHWGEFDEQARQALKESHRTSSRESASGAIHPYGPAG